MSFYGKSDVWAGFSEKLHFLAVHFRSLDRDRRYSPGLETTPFEPDWTAVFTEPVGLLPCSV